MARGLTQMQLAERAGMERVTLAKIETGKRKLQIEELLSLAAVLDVDPLRLVGDQPLTITVA